MSIANSHGWEIGCPAAIEAEWNGGDQAKDVTVVAEGLPHAWASSKVGSGILTFNPHVVFRTPPGYNLWVTGPVNSFKDALQAISGVVESDWIPYHFTMNWKFTRPGVRVRFERGELRMLALSQRLRELKRVESARESGWRLAELPRREIPPPLRRSPQRTGREDQASVQPVEKT